MLYSRRMTTPFRVAASILVALTAIATASIAAALTGPEEFAEEQSLESGSDDTEVGPIFLLGLGGKLYDDLWSILDMARPAGRNPAMQDIASVSAADTWRCVTCHGWDYRGTDFGGKTFPGIRSLEHAEPELVSERLRDLAHPFPAEALSDTAIEVLALFVTSGQYERADFIDARGRALGNPEFGRDIFEGACISCHQLDGRTFLRGGKGHASLGSVASERPAQALHRILNGVPAAEMLSLRFLSEVQIADLLAYLQTLDDAN
jgi:cytochrome c553